MKKITIKFLILHSLITWGCILKGNAQEREITPINMLPAPILNKVFGYALDHPRDLSPLVLTCKTWNETLWQKNRMALGDVLLAKFHYSLAKFSLHQRKYCVDCSLIFQILNINDEIIRKALKSKDNFFVHLKNIAQELTTSKATFKNVLRLVHFYQHLMILEWKDEYNLPFLRYMGEGLNGLFNGQGYLVDDWGLYIGRFEEGLRTGKGKQTKGWYFFYEGEFLNDTFHGKGKWSQDRGETVYEGDFVKGQFEGLGTLIEHIDSRLTIITEGSFKAGRPEKVKTTFPYGDVHEIDSKRCGIVKVQKANGDVYEGHLFTQKYHGEGKLIKACGDVYEGEFCLGYFHGKGKLTKKDGSVYKGEFNNGEFIESCNIL